MTMSSQRKAFLIVAAIVFAVATVVVGVNFLLINQPIQKELSTDARNDSFTLRGHFGAYMLPNALVIDLVDVGSVAPVDLMRGLFSSAATMHSKHRGFKRVELRRDGKQIYEMSGEDFAELGSSFQNGENPIYLVRTLPEKIKMPDGSSAFGRWEGGLLGVVGKQMEDANAFARHWAGEDTGASH